MPRYYADGKSKEFRGLLLKLCAFAAFLGGIGLLIAIVFGRQVLTLIYEAQYAEYQNEFIWVMFGSLLYFVGPFLNYGVTATRAFNRGPASLCGDDGRHAERCGDPHPESRHPRRGVDPLRRRYVEYLDAHRGLHGSAPTSAPRGNTIATSRDMAPSTSKVGRLPLIYRMHGAVYRALTAFGHVTIRGIHVFTVVANLLNRFAFKTYLSDPRALEAATKEGFRMLVPLNDQSSASVMFRGEYDTDQSKAIANLLSVTSAMLDIGANLGYFSLLAAQNTKPDFPIIAVEPNAELCELIGSSIGLNGFGNVSVVRAAAGEAVGRANLELDIRRSSNATVTFEGTESESAVDVLTVDTLAERLPDELEAPPLVKIDVEGLGDPRPERRSRSAIDRSDRAVRGFPTIGRADRPPPRGARLRRFGLFRSVGRSRPSRKEAANGCRHVSCEFRRSCPSGTRTSTAAVATRLPF